MRYKKGICKGCNKNYYLFSKSLCQFCYAKQVKKKPIKKPTKPIAKFSKKHLEKLKEYRILRDKFLKENNKCMYPGCESMDITLHHGSGRCGDLLTDVRFFKSLCWEHHQEIETNPELAKSLNLSHSRLQISDNPELNQPRPQLKLGI